MEGGLLQLIAKDVKDMPLIGKPEITPFKKLYRKYNPFAIMQHQVILPDMKLGSHFNTTLSQAGDLLSKIYLEIEIPDFLIEKKILKKNSILKYSDEDFLVKQQILERFSQIENKLEYLLNDETIFKFSPKSLGKFLQILDYQTINKNINEYSIDYSNNFQVINFLLNSNLTNEMMILGLYFLDYLQVSVNEILDSGNNILEKKYHEILDTYIKNYYLEVTYNEKTKYQIYDEENYLDVFSQSINYYLNNEIKSDLKYINDKIKTESQELITLTKSILDFDFQYMLRFLHQIFPEDNFYSNFSFTKTIYPFFILLSYEADLQNKFDSSVLDKRFTLENYWVNNFLELGSQSGFLSPISKITEETLATYRSKISKELEANNYQEILGNNTQELWATIASIQELWKWQIFNYVDSSDNTNVFVPSYEGDNLTKDISAFPAFLLGSWEETENMVNNLRIDFTLKDLSFNNPKNIEEIINDLSEILPNLIKFNPSYSHLNRAGFDLNLIYLYTFYLFCNKLKLSNIFKNNSSKAWINWMFQCVTNKFFSRWVSQYQVRISTDYLRVESVINTEAVTSVNIEEKIPFISLGDNEYFITSDTLRELISSQTKKHNYVIKIQDNENQLITNNNYKLETTKIYQNLSISSYNKQIIINLKYFYHHPNNKYYFTKKNENSLIILNFISNNNNQLEFYGNLEDGEFEGDLTVILNLNIPIISEKSFEKNYLQKITDISSTIYPDEIERYHFNLLVRDKNDNLIDILLIPSLWIDISSEITLNNFNLPSDISDKYQDYSLEYWMIDIKNLPNLFNLVSYTDYSENINLNYASYTFTDLSNALINDFTDDFRQTSYFHEIPFGILSNDFVILYHLPYKINSQILDNKIIKVSNTLGNLEISTKFRFNNFINYYENIDGETRIVSEGIDFYDKNLNLNYFLNLSNFEEEHLEIIQNNLLEQYNLVSSGYQKIINLLDEIQNVGFETFINTFNSFSSIGFTYQEILNKFIEENSNNLSEKQLIYWKNKSFNENFYWKSKIYFNDSASLTSKIYLEDISSLVIENSDLHNLVSYYQLNQIFDDSAKVYLNNIGFQLKTQLENLENNRDILLKFPKTTNQDTFNTTSFKTEYQIEKIYSDSLKNNYILETTEDLSSYQIIKVNQQVVNLVSQIDNNLYQIESSVDLPVSLPEDGIQHNKIMESFNKGNFYGYGILKNKLISLLPDLSIKNYQIYNSNFEELDLSFNEINDKYLIINNQDLSSEIINFTDILILKDDLENYYPYGKIFPSLNNNNLYYRKQENQQPLNSFILLVGSYLLENPKRLDNFIISPIDFSNNNVILPIIQIDLKDFIYETHKTNITLSLTSGRYRLFTNLSLKLRPLDYIFIDDNWYQIKSYFNSSDDNYYEIQNNLLTPLLTLGIRTNFTLKIFRYLSNIIPSINSFKSFESDGDLTYDYQTLTWDNHLLVYQELVPLHIKKQEGVILELLEDLQVGDILYSNNEIYQITQKNQLQYQIYPLKIFDQVYCIKNFFNTNKIFEDSLYFTNLNVNIKNNTDFILRDVSEYPSQTGAYDTRYAHFKTINVNNLIITNIPREIKLHDYTETLFQVYKTLDFTITLSDDQYFFGNDVGPRYFYFKGWIDWQNTGSFEDNSNNVIFDYRTANINPVTSNFSDISFNITIPDDTRLGITRMRIIMLASASSSLSLTPDFTIHQGIASDFAIKISNPNTVDNFNSILNNQVIYLPLRTIPTTNHLINLHEEAEWIYREIRLGDFYYENNLLNLNLDLSEGKYWILQPRYNFTNFIPTNNSGWFENYSNESFELNLGSIILDVSSISISETYDLSQIYQGLPIVIIDGKLGNLVHLKSINSYNLSLLSGEKLIQQYPWKFKSPYNSNNLINYQNLLAWDNTSSNLFDGDFSDNYIIYLELPFDLATTKSTIDFSGLVTLNEITLSSGINLNNYQLIDFSEDLIKPRQEILVDNVRTRVLEYQNNKLILDKNITDFSDILVTMNLFNLADKENFINQLNINPFIDLFTYGSIDDSINLSILKLNNTKTKVINHYLEKGYVENITYTKVTIRITDNLIDFIKNNSLTFTSGEAENDLIYVNLNNLLLDNNYQIDEINKTLSVTYFKNKKFINNDKVVLFEELTPNNERLIHYGKVGISEKEELGITFLNNQDPYDRNSIFYLDRRIKCLLYPDTFNIKKIGNTYYLDSDVIWSENFNVFITLRDNEIFDGQGYTISVKDTEGSGNHFGIFQVLGTSYATAPIIKNVIVKSQVFKNGGGIIRGYDTTYNLVYPKYFIIENCLHIGNIDTDAGGIVGSYAGFQGQFRISSCWSEGNLLETLDGGGGLTGIYCARDGIGLIEKSAFIGEICGGGICGNYAGSFGGELRISNCYTTGQIRIWYYPFWANNFSGGITSKYGGANDGKLIIDNCYAMGIIDTSGGTSCGGICGFRTALLENSTSTSEVYIMNSYCQGQIFANLGLTSYSDRTDIYVDLSKVDISNNSNISCTTINLIENQIDTSLQIDSTDLLGIGVDLSDITYWDTTTIWLQGTSTSSDSDTYPKLRNFQNLPFDSTYQLNITTPEYDESIRNVSTTFYVINPISIEYNNITKSQDNNLIDLELFKKIEIEITDVPKINEDNLFYLSTQIKSDFSSLIPNLDNFKLYLDPSNNNTLDFYQSFEDASNTLVSENPISIAKYQYYLKYSNKIQKLYPKFNKINNQIINYTDDINNLLITQNNSLVQELTFDYLLIPYVFTIENISEVYKGYFNFEDLSAIVNLNTDYQTSINDSSLIIKNLQQNLTRTLGEITNLTDLVEPTKDLSQNIDIFFKIPRNQDYYSETINLHQDLINHYYDFQNFNQNNYLINYLLLNQDWTKFYRLNQSSVNNSPFDDEIIDLSGHSYFSERFLDLSDYQVLISQDLSSIDSDELDKHEYLNKIIYMIYHRIPQWILLKEFRDDPNSFLNDWLSSYQLSFNNNFFDLSNNQYLSVIIPTNFEIDNSNNKIKYKISPDNQKTQITSLFNTLNNLDFSNNNISTSEIEELSKLIDFYSFWDTIKTYQNDLLSYVSPQINLYQVVGNQLQINQTELNTNAVLEIIKETSPIQLINQELLTQQNFPYSLNLERLPVDTSFNQVDFKETQAIFYDPIINNLTYDSTQLSYNIPRFLPDQKGTVNGYLTYQVLNQELLGEKITIITNKSLETDLSDSYSTFNYQFKHNGKNLDLVIINDTNFEIVNDTIDNLATISFEVTVPVKIIRNKFYLPDNINLFTQSDTVYLRKNDTLEILDLSGTQINNLTHQTFTPNVTLVRYTLISTITSNNRYQYLLTLNNSLNLSPYQSYQTSSEDFKFYDSSNNLINNILIELKESNQIKVYLEEEKNLSKIEQQFRIGDTPNFDLISYELSLDGSEINVVSQVNIDLSGYQSYQFQYTDQSENEVGNYLIKFSGNDLSTNLLNQKAYLENNQYFGKFVNINSSTQGWISTIDLFNTETSYNIVVPSLINSLTIDLSSDYLPSNFEFSIDDSNNIINNDNLKVDFTLPSSLPIIDYSNNDNSTILLGKIVLSENTNLITNNLIKNWQKQLDNLQENYYQIETSYDLSEEPVIYQDKLGFNIIDKVGIKIENEIIEEIDKDWMNLHNYYFIPEEHQRGIEKIINHSSRITIPLPFFFTRGYQNSFPNMLCYDSKKFIYGKLASLDKLINNTGLITNQITVKARLLYETIWLSDEEKLNIASRNQEYLISTINFSQRENIAKLNQELYLRFRGAVKDFFFILKTPSNNWLETYLEVDDTSQVDEYYLDYLTNYQNQTARYLDYSENKTTLMEDFSNTLLDDYSEDFQYYLIYYYMDNKYDGLSTTPDEGYVRRKLLLYFTYSHHEIIKKKLYPLEKADLVINDRQLFTKKPYFFWSLIHQDKYIKSGDLDKYGYSHCLYPLQDQPSGHFNYDKLKALMRLELNPEFYAELQNNYKYMIMKIYYRKYRLLKFMGNQVGVLF